MKIVVDEDLLKYDKVWTAGGTPNSVFSISISNLMAATGGMMAIIK